MPTCVFVHEKLKAYALRRRQTASSSLRRREHVNAALLTTVAEGAEKAAHHTELPMDPIFFGLITLAIFLSMAAVSRSWKGISNRH